MVIKSQPYILLFSLLFSVGLNGQNEYDWQLKAGISYGHGFITEQTQTLQGQFNLGLEKDNFEARLDAFYLFKQQGDRVRFLKNNQVFLGGYYYFLKNNLRPYCGAQIGFAHAQSTEYGTLNEKNSLETESAINPIASFGAGMDYKLNQRLDLSIECRQIFGKHIANSYPTYLDEFRISIGVGIYLINKTTN
ncbi:MAG: hypothetical protein AB8B74_15115 [Crocinitomicaceae bacterium]